MATPLMASSCELNILVVHPEVEVVEEAVEDMVPGVGSEGGTVGEEGLAIESLGDTSFWCRAYHQRARGKI